MCFLGIARAKIPSARQNMPAMRTAACGLTGTLDTGTCDAESTCFTLSHSMCGMYLITSRLFPDSGNTGFISRISLAFWDPPQNLCRFSSQEGSLCARHPQRHSLRRWLGPPGRTAADLGRSLRHAPSTPGTSGRLARAVPAVAVG